MDSQKVLAEAAQIIPEGYVDIIRRVTPGAVFWLVLHFLTGFPRIPSEGFGVANLILFLLASYATGMLLDASADYIMGGCLVRHVWESVPEDEDIQVIGEILDLDAKDLVCPRTIRRCREWKVPDLLREEVIRADAKAAVVLPKLIAEECLLKNLALGLGAVALTMIVAGWLGIHWGPKLPQNRWAVLGLISIIALFSYGAALHRARRTLIRTLGWAKHVHRGIVVQAAVVELQAGEEPQAGAEPKKAA